MATVHIKLLKEKQFTVIKYSQLQINEKIGEGAFGEVYRCLLFNVAQSYFLGEFIRRQK